MENTGEKVKMRVALYIRVSTQEQADKYGVDLQLSALKALILSKPNDLSLAENHIYIDENVSGTVNIDERPEFGRLKENILMAPEGEKPFDVVAVYKIDRFARQLRILLEVIDLFKTYDIQFISANESIDTSTPFGKAMLGIVGVIAELERDTIMQRTRDGRWQAFEQGVVLGNSAPYGYTKNHEKKYAVFEEEAKTVREIFRLFVEENMSVNSIAHYLRDHKVNSPSVSAILHHKRKGHARKKNNPYFWTVGTVRRLLEDEIYIGRIYGNKTVKGKAVDKKERILSKAPAPLVIDLITFENTQRLLKGSNFYKRSTKNDHVYLLSGLLKCDCCFNLKSDGEGGRVGWHGEGRDLSSKRTHYYQCGRKSRSKTSTLCTSIPLRAHEMEEYVVDYARKLLKSPVAVFEHQQRLRSQMKTIEHLTNRDKYLLDLTVGADNRKKNARLQQLEGYIDMPALEKEYKKADEDKARYSKERDDVQMQIAQHTLSKGYIKALDLFSERYEFALKEGFDDRKVLNIILRELIEEIVIYGRPVTKADPIAGRKKNSQQIPHRIHIKLKLPSDILRSISATLSESDVDSEPSSEQKTIASAR